MRLRKEVQGMDTELKDAFKIVARDIASLIIELKESKYRIHLLENKVTSLRKNNKRFYTVGPVTGRTYTTLNGRVHALAQHLGVAFDVTPKEVVVNKAKISAVKVTKKASKS